MNNEIIHFPISTIITEEKKIIKINDNEWQGKVTIKCKDDSLNKFDCIIKLIRNTQGEILHYIYFC